jgi:hypothetical protein
VGVADSWSGVGDPAVVAPEILGEVSLRQIHGQDRLDMFCMFCPFLTTVGKAPGQQGRGAQRGHDRVLFLAGLGMTPTPADTTPSIRQPNSAPSVDSGVAQSVTRLGWRAGPCRTVARAGTGLPSAPSGAA